MPKKKEGAVTFYSPRAKEQTVVVEPQEWLTTRTPAGDRTIQSPGKTAQFSNGMFITDDPDIIEYLTNVYSDKRHPIVRTDVKENKTGGSKPPAPKGLASKSRGSFPGQS
mgnify:CR=1 FL=1|jgi:hypothetical protein|tara:strand:+ start:2801 stop:3130 length:330 start_codon:yes stop_codon:yes gene_type:complete